MSARVTNEYCPYLFERPVCTRTKLVLQGGLANLPDSPHNSLYDFVSHLVYSVDVQDVQTVIVDGQVLMHDRKVLTLNEDEVIKKARAIAARIDKEIRSGQ